MVERSLSMREVPGSIPGASNTNVLLIYASFKIQWFFCNNLLNTSISVWVNFQLFMLNLVTNPFDMFHNPNC